MKAALKTVFSFLGVVLVLAALAAAGVLGAAHALRCWSRDARMARLSADCDRLGGRHARLVAAVRELREENARLADRLALSERACAEARAGMAEKVRAEAALREDVRQARARAEQAETDRQRAETGRREAEARAQADRSARSAVEARNRRLEETESGVASLEELTELTERALRRKRN